MRVRTFGLRLLAAVLTALWTIAGAIVLLGYRPGGPIDGLVGLAALLPLAASFMGLLWPPAPHGTRAYPAIAWLGLGAVLLLIPSIGGVLTQLLARGPQTLLPSWEAVYPWILALVATSLFGGLGVARRILAGSGMRRRRVVLGVAIAAMSTTLIGSAFAAAAIANELALRNTQAISSRFGPAAGPPDPPHCTDPLQMGSSAVIALAIRGDVDGRPIGTIDLRGERNGLDVSWSADVATEVAIGQFALVRLGGVTRTRIPREDWQVTPTDGIAVNLTPDGVPFPSLAHPALDLEVLAASLTPGYRSAAEERGLEFVEGARARHCRIAMDGRTFQAAFPAAGWMSAQQDLHRWRGTLDYWVFLDGEVGQVIADVNGEALGLGRAGLQASLYATLTATDRGRGVTIEAPRT
jgi:hypothetical protein